MRPPQPLFLPAIFASCIFLLCPYLRAQSANPTQPQTPPTPSPSEHQRGKLERGKPIEHELKGGEADIYTIKVRKGQFLHVVVEQNGVNLLLTISGPGGHKIAEAGSINEGWGPFPASMIANVASRYHIRLEAEDKNAGTTKYRILVSALRAPQPMDQKRIDAEHAKMEGARLFIKQDAASVRAAIDTLDNSLPLWRVLGDRYEEAIILAAIGQSYRLLSEMQKATDNLTKALAILRALGDRRDETAVLMNLGIVSSKSGRQREALDDYIQARRILEELGDRRALGRAHDNIAEVYSDLGENQKALSEYQQALDLARATGDLQDQGSVLANLGRLNRRLGNMQQALDYYSQALGIARQIGDRLQEGVILNNSGLVYARLGNWQKALELYNQALPIRRELGDRHGEISTLTNLGSVYWDMGDGQKSLDFTFQSLAIARDAGFKPDEANALHNIGATYARLGENTKALDYFNQALVLRRAIGDRSGEASTLGSIAAMFRELGDLNKALENAQQELSLAKALGERPMQAGALNDVATLLSEMGDKQQALDYYNQALPLQRAVGSRSGEAVTLSSMGVVYQALGDGRQAMDDFNQALELERAINDRPHETVTLFNLAKTREKLGEKQEALSNYLQALSVARAIKSLPMEGAILAGLMEYWRNEKNLSAAIFLGKQSVSAYQRMRANTRGLDKSLQRSFVQSKSGVYRELADLLIAQGRLFEAQEVLDLLKEQEYFEFIRRDGASADSLTKPVSLTSEEKKILGEYEKIADEVTAIDAEWSQLRAKPDRTHDEEQRFSDLTEKLKAANDRMELYFHDLYTAFAGGKLEKKNVEQVREETTGLQSLVAELGPGTVALYTLVTESNYRVIVITPNAMQPREYAISQLELRRKVAALLASLRNPQGDPLAASQDLYKILIAPIEKDLRGAKAKTLMWSLDGVLRYVPISALHDGKQYMVENYRNVVFTPASIARLKDQPGAKTDRGLGMGVSKDYDGLGPLPQVPQELRRIIHDDAVEGAKGVIPGTLMLDDSFTEKNMEKALEQRHRLIHIASHFVLQPGNELDSYLLLGGKDEGGKGYHLTLAELRSDPRLAFSDTDLLTLSACQTAITISGADGHEVDGLGIMAQQRGAKAVMATLWSVDDESTALLMADFYSRWTEHPDVNKAEALRQAQVAMLRSKQQIRSSAGTPAGQANSGSQRQFSHPYYWAPFILIGNWK